MAKSTVKELTILIHGVWSRGQGFTKVRDVLHADFAFPADYHRVKMYDHGFTWPWDTWSSGTRIKLRDACGGYYHRQLRKYPNLERINVVAHSFGTWGILDYLLDISPHEMQTINNLITVGSVAPKPYPWEHIIDEKGVVDNAINIISRWDIVPMLGWLVRLGCSGDFIASFLTGQQPGFTTEHEQVVNTVVNGFHSWYSTDEGADLIRMVLHEQGKWTGPYTELAHLD